MDYQGDELDIFSNARRWKRYWGSRLRPYVTGDVLEVGAGIGASMAELDNDSISSWTALEPDPGLAARIDTSYPWPVSVEVGDMTSFSGRFNTVLYIDVLEHIEDDHAELARAAECLTPGGTLLVLSPAHEFLFSEFDASIGHHRRYNRETISALTPKSTQLIHVEYLDAVGMLASLTNRWLLRSGSPSQGQILFWDRAMVPLSRVLDPLTLHRIGKTIIGIWRREPF